MLINQWIVFPLLVSDLEKPEEIWLRDLDLLKRETRSWIKSASENQTNFQHVGAEKVF